MKTKTEKIKIPEGYEWDYFSTDKNGTVEIHYKKIEREVKCWDDIEELEGCYINGFSEIIDYSKNNGINYNQNVFPTKQDAESALALAQLLQVRKYYVEDWKPDWKAFNDSKYCIRRWCNSISVLNLPEAYRELSFPTKAQAEEFLKHNEELIKVYFKLTPNI